MGCAEKCPKQSRIGAEAWGMGSAERRKVNVLEMKCLECHEWIELGMKRCVGELEYKVS